MRKTFVAFVGALVLVASQASISQAILVAGWTFETSIPTTAGPHSAELGVNAGAGSPATGLHAGATVYSNPSGNGTAESFSSTLWAVGDYYQFSTSTVGYSGLTLSFDQTSSSTGPAQFTIQTSTDGTTFSNLLDYTVLGNGIAPNASWTSGTYVPAYTFASISLPASLNNQAAVYIRLLDRSTVAANGGTVATGGTSRVDSVSIVAAVPEASSFLFGGMALCAAGAPALRRRWKARKA